MIWKINLLLVANKYFFEKVIIEMEKINLVALLWFHFSLHLGQIWQISSYQHRQGLNRFSPSVLISSTWNINKLGKQRSPSHQEWVSKLLLLIWSNLSIVVTCWSYARTRIMDLTFWDPTLPSGGEQNEMFDCPGDHSKAGADSYWRNPPLSSQPGPAHCQPRPGHCQAGSGHQDISEVREDNTRQIGGVSGQPIWEVIKNSMVFIKVSKYECFLKSKNQCLE